jgi:AcrR family transcriptional regulator
MSDKERKNHFMKNAETTVRSLQPETQSAGDHDTRSRILEAAGRLFSDRGYERTTAREICELARVNPAAVNYHFGGKRRLYLDVIRETDRRVVDREALKQLLLGEEHPEEKLGKFVRAILHAFLKGDAGGWHNKLFLREMSSPTEAFGEIFESQIRPSLLLFRRIVAEIIQLPPDHPAVIRGALSVISQCLFVFQNRTTIERFLLELDFQPGSIEELARHITAFALGGLKEVQRQWKEKEAP